MVLAVFFSKSMMQGYFSLFNVEETLLFYYLKTVTESHASENSAVTNHHQKHLSFSLSSLFQIKYTKFTKFIMNIVWTWWTQIFPVTNSRLKIIKQQHYFRESYTSNSFSFEIHQTQIWFNTDPKSVHLNTDLNFNISPQLWNQA